MSRNIVSLYLSSADELVRSLIRGRRLLYALSKREISDEYVTHSFSMAWPIAHPLILMCVYLFIFTQIFPSRMEALGVLETNSVVYLMSGIIPWLVTAQIMAKAIPSIVNNAVIVKQMAFPLEFLPVKTLAAPLLSTGISLAFLAVYAGFLTAGASIPAYLIGIPILIVVTVTSLVGLALLLSTAQVFVRDSREIVNIFLAIGLFVHPILYFPGAIPESVRTFIYLSPFTYLLYCWQDVLYFGAVTRPEAWLISIGVSLLMLVVGARVFMGSRAHFGDFL